MAATIQNLQDELAVTQSQIDAIDLPNIQSQIEVAKAELSLTKEPTGHLSAAHTALLQELSRAENLLSSEQSKLRSLERQARPLQARLTAPARLEAASADLAVLQGRAADAAGVVASAQATQTALAGLLADAQADYAAHLEDAAKAVLAGAKQGKAVASVPVDRGHVASREGALQMAEAELATAQARHAESLSDLTAGQRHLAECATDAAALSFELKLRDFVNDVLTFQAAGGSFDVDGLAERVLIGGQNAAN